MNYENFTRWVENFANKYSSFLVVGTEEDALFKALSDLGVSDDGVCNGGFDEETKGFYFDLLGKSPDFIYELTLNLKCRGYASTEWDEPKVEIADKGGNANDGFTVRWQEGSPKFVEGNSEIINAAVIIEDDESGAEFYCGGNAMSFDFFCDMRRLVMEHPYRKYITATCDYCDYKEKYYLSAEEESTLNRYIVYGRQMGPIQTLFPKIPAWIRSGAIDQFSGGFCICPSCSG